jgi:Zn-dependent protease with chaperone function
MNPAARQSLFGRAVIAILLTIGFYGLALAIAFGLLYLIYLEITVLERINVRLTLFAFIGAVVILWAIFPRVDRFTAPGPRLSPAKFPELFKEIGEIARATGQEMPREVYLIADVNAFVTERGGLMGIGSRRVMGIGLPLFHLLTVDELNSILAHEFGHFYGGDTALGPWIYKTRAAIIRTVTSVGKTNQWLLIPFEAYARMFLRVTNAVSRQQEFTADQLSARTVGAKAAISSLQKIHKYGLAFDAYFRQDYIPVIEAGYRPPILDGFALFLKTPQVQEAVNHYYEEQATQGQTDPYDTHPSMKERIAALQGLPDDRPHNNSEAITLLPADIEGLESILLKGMLRREEDFVNLKKIGWENVAESAYLPQWEKAVETYRPILKSLTTGALFEITKNIPSLFQRFAQAGDFLADNVKAEQVPQETQAQVTGNLVGAALAVMLHRAGWTIKTNVGEDVAFRKGAQELKPFTVSGQLFAGQMSADQWQTLCTENQIADLTLA